MDKLKKAFGSNKEEQDTGGQSGASTNTPLRSQTQSAYTGSEQLVGSGINQPTQPSSASESSSQWRDSTLAGLGVSNTPGSSTLPTDTTEGLQRESTGDDVSDSTYKARSYQLPASTPSQPFGPSRTVEPTDTTLAPEPQSSEYIRDGSLAGAGTITGAGVGAADLAAQESRPVDQEVENATYTDRSYQMAATPGNSVGSGVPDPSKTASGDMPHIPGEWPATSGEDPHGSRTGAYPFPTPSEQADRDVGSRTSAVGAVEPRPLGDELAKNDTSAPEQHHYGRDAAIAGGTLAGAGAGYGVYEATKDPITAQPQALSQAEPQEPSVDPPLPPVKSENQYDTSPAVAGAAPISTAGAETENIDPASVRRDVPNNTTNSYQPDDLQADENNYGKDAAVVGGATALAGAGGYGAYEATRGSEARENAPADTTDSYQSGEPLDSDKKYGRDAAVVGGATTLAGAGGYGAYEATRANEQPISQSTVGQPVTQQPVVDPTQRPVATSEGPAAPVHNEPVHSRPTHSEPVKSEPTQSTKPQPIETKAQETQPQSHDYARDTTAGAAEPTSPRQAQTPTKTDLSRSSIDSEDPRVSTDARGHHHLHKKSVEQPGEKKPGLVHRILHRDKAKQGSEREEGRRSYEQPGDQSMGSPTSPTSSQRGHVGTDGQIGDPDRVSGGER